MDTAIKRLVVQCPSQDRQGWIQQSKTCSPVPFPGQAEMDTATKRLVVQCPSLDRPGMDTAIKRLVVQCPSLDRQEWIQQSKDL
ncbi:hypothetical protein DPMN_083374 [Dreissena polymorpha]|uniref:Uncharacterized protein n=1 Tax=Dreissena polymorpha TaxID=45954 RepID=A0A9D4BB17_DREPO|nr:hypothetical protein DPMN_083374 [Dreissena polymorpha]